LILFAYYQTGFDLILFAYQRAPAEARRGGEPATENAIAQTSPASVRVRVQGQGADFRVSASGFRIQGSGFGVQGSGLRVQGSGCRVQGSGSRIRVPGTESMVSGVVLRARRLGFRVSGALFRV
jgi:hypothetical protein